MMIKSFESEKADWLMRKIIPNDKFWKLNPVIAGGAALSVYKALKLYDSEYKWKSFKRETLSLGRRSKVDNFGDVDVWFLEKNILEKNILNLIYSDDINKLRSASSLDIFNLPNRENAFLKGSSKWANSFGTGFVDLYSGDIQIIKRRPKDIEDLFSTFDFINCQVAFYSGRIYYNKKLEKAFKRFELEIDDETPYLKLGMAGKIFNALRAFKYSKRFGLDFDKKLTDYVFNLYVATKDIDYSKYEGAIVELERIYGTRLASVDTLKSMVSSLRALYYDFSRMKYFREEYPLFLLDQSTDIPGLDRLLCRDPNEYW
jgi:hypothetical protein